MKLNFFVADEIRPELNGKLTALGMFADNTVVLESQNAMDSKKSGIPAGFDRLAFVVNISDAQGEKHSFKGQIVDPTGKNHGPEIPLGENVFGRNSSRTIIVEAKPFVMNGTGTYYFNFYVDDVLHPFPFNIIDRAEVIPTV